MRNKGPKGRSTIHPSSIQCHSQRGQGDGRSWLLQSGWSGEAAQRKCHSTLSPALLWPVVGKIAGKHPWQKKGRCLNTEYTTLLLCWPALPAGVAVPTGLLLLWPSPLLTDRLSSPCHLEGHALSVDPQRQGLFADVATPQGSLGQKKGWILPEFSG